MLEYINNNLTYSGDIIISNETIISLTTDIENAVIFGKLSLTNGFNKTMQFIKYSDTTYKAKLLLTEDMKSNLQGSYFNLILISETGTMESNLIQLNFDLEKINFSINSSTSQDYVAIIKNIAALEKTVNSLALGHIIDNIKINNQDYIKKGMILQAIDDNGNFVAVYPFIDIVKEVNGQKAINNSIILDASMIQYNQKKTIAEAIVDLTDAIRALNDELNTHSNAIKRLQDDVTELSETLHRHLNDGII